MTGFMLGLILFTGYGYNSVLVPVIYPTEQACNEAGLQTGYASAKDNPAMINGKPNADLPNKMWVCTSAAK